MSASALFPDLELRYRLDAVYQAQKASTYVEARGDMPSPSEIRDLLRLFARVENDDLRQAFICLLRTIVGPSH